MATMIPSDPWSTPRLLLPAKSAQAAPIRPPTPPAGARDVLVYAPVVGAAASLAVGILGLLDIGPSFLRRRRAASAVLCATGLILLLREPLARHLPATAR
jgi:hypothetical protein